MSCALNTSMRRSYCARFLIDSGQLVARRAESAARRMAQRREIAAALSLLVSIRSSVSAPTMPSRPGIELADLARVLTRGFDDAAGRGVDDRG